MFGPSVARTTSSITGLICGLLILLDFIIDRPSHEPGAGDSAQYPARRGHQEKYSRLPPRLCKKRDRLFWKEKILLPTYAAPVEVGPSAGRNSMFARQSPSEEEIDSL